jgi:DNA end-binding protein Ku
MAARAIWKGVIVLQRVKVPVRLYSAVEDRDVHFRLLHAKDKTPVHQRMVDPSTGKTVPRERIHRGLEVESGVYVMLDPEELAELEPEASREIEVTRFVDPAAIPAQLYDRPYWVGPDGDAAAYLALADALARKGKHGIVRFTMRKKRYAAALHSDGEHLSLIVLRPAQEVVTATELDAPEGRELQAAERKMAEQLVAALEGPFDPAEFQDEFRERVLDLVRRKAKGQKVRLPRQVERKPSGESLQGALRASLAAARKSEESREHATARERKTA